MKQVVVGCRVRLQFTDEEVEYTVQSPRVGKITLGEISTDSPLGKALVGKKEGDVVSTVLAENQMVCCTIVSVD